LGSVVNPRTDHHNWAAVKGDAIHAHLDARSKLGIERAREQVDKLVESFGMPEIEASIAKAMCRTFDYEPPPGSIPEIALAWRVDGDEAEVIEIRGGKGKYELGPTEGAPGTFDLIFADPDPLEWDGDVPICPDNSTLWVVDYKTGSDAWVDPIEVNYQLKSAVAKAAYWTGARRVMPAVLYVQRGGGVWDVPDEPWAEDKIDQAMWDVFDLHEQIAAAQKAGRLDRSQYVEGYYCRYCPSLSYCPIMHERVRNLLEFNAERRQGVLTEAEMRRAAAMLPIIQQLGRWIESVVKTHVKEHGPIDIGAGRMYGRKVKPVDVLDGAKLIPIISEVLGDEESAMAAVQMTKSSIDTAVRKAHEKKGIKRQASRAMRQILAKGYDSGAIEKQNSEKWGVYVPGEEK
jgi:hypothetical protein